MATPRITMRKLRDILRLRLDAGLSIRQIQAVTKASIGLIQKLVARAEALKLDWPLPAELDDNKLQALFYPAPNSTNTNRPLTQGHSMPTCFLLPDFKIIR